MIVSYSSMMETEPKPVVLTAGVEVWSMADGVMVREDATPSIGDLDRSLGQAKGGVVDEQVTQVCSSRMPQLASVVEGKLSVLLWPVIDRERVTAVVTVYLTMDASASMAAEVWAGRPGRSELCLVDSQYACLDRFAKLSQYIAFPKGSGLPGLAWQSNIPQLINGLGSSPMFMRATGAASEGLDVGFAIPCIDGMSLQAVALLLSGSGLPIARAFETWVPAQQGGSIRLKTHEGVYLGADELQKASQGLSVPAGDTWVGRAWATRRPIVVSDSSGAGLERRGASEAGLTSGIAIPIIVLDDVVAVAVMMW